MSCVFAYLPVQTMAKLADYLIFKPGLTHFTRKSYLTKIISSKLHNKTETEITTSLTTTLKPQVKSVIGLEVHAQLNTNSKVFSKGGNDYEAFPNSQLDFYDIALPGSLPQFNLCALKAAIISSLSLNCTIQNEIHFDRKNYFYPDMPSGYQITQYNKPIAVNGYLEFVVTPYHRVDLRETFIINKYLSKQPTGSAKCEIKRSKIKQVQLEQDSAKTFHESFNNERFTLVDYNRSGSGLIEIVFEPDLSNSTEAAALVRELMTLLKIVGTCGCELQEGSLRVDANVSISQINGLDVGRNGERVELKNLNSLKAIRQAIDYEVERQTQLLCSDQIVQRETRTFNSKERVTVPMRLKEESIDYRFVPEPSIPPLIIEDNFVEDMKILVPPNLPRALRQELILKYNLSIELLPALIEKQELRDLFTKVMDERRNFDANVIADFLIYTVSSIENLPVQKDGYVTSNMYTQKIVGVFDLLFEAKIGFATAFELIKYYFINRSDKKPETVVQEFGWFQVNDTKTVNEICQDLVIKMPNISKKYKKTGKTRFLRMMIENMNEKYDCRVNVKLAIISLNTILKPPKE